MANVWHVLEYGAYAFSIKKLRSATIESHLSAIKLLHRISRGFKIDTTHPVIANALKGAARLHADVGNQATERRPVSWYMLLAGEELIPAYRVGVRVLWLALCASFCLFTPASEMFAETRLRVHETYCLRRTDVAFFRANTQLTVAQWSTADRVEVRLRGSKGDQLRKGAVATRVRKGPSMRVGEGGVVVDLMIEFMSCYLFLPSSAPLVAFGVGNGNGPCGHNIKQRQLCGTWLRWRVCVRISAPCTPSGIEAQRTCRRGVQHRRCFSVGADGRPMLIRRTSVVMERTPLV